MSDPTQRGLAAANRTSGPAWGVALVVIVLVFAVLAVCEIVSTTVDLTATQAEADAVDAALVELRGRVDRLQAQLDELERRERQDLYHSTGEVGR